MAEQWLSRAQALLKMFPNVEDLFSHVSLEDSGDGEGSKIIVWDVPGETKPTLTEIDDFITNFGPIKPEQYWKPEDFFKCFTIEEEAAVRFVAKTDTMVETLLARVERAEIIVSTDPLLVVGRDYLLAIRDSGGHDGLPSIERWESIGI